MYSNRPSTIVEDELFAKFLNKLNTAFSPPSRKTCTKKEEDISNFLKKQLKSSLQNAAKYFTVKNEVKPFVQLQYDGWTSQGNVGFLAISVSFYDQSSDKAHNVLLEIYEVERGKRAIDLSVILKTVLKTFDVPVRWVGSFVTDQERAAMTAFSRLNPQSTHHSCFVHVLQTVVRHGTGLPSKLYKRDPFVAGRNFSTK